MEKLDLEQELNVRYDAAVKVSELIKEMNNSITFLQNKSYFICDSHFIDNKLILPFLDYLISEIENAKNKLIQLSNIKRCSILTLPTMDSINTLGCVDICWAIDKMFPNGELKEKREKLNDMNTFFLFGETEYNKTKGLDDEAIVKEFSKMRKRYAKDQKRKHEILREETCSPKDSFRDLINSSKNIPQVKIWNDTDHDLLKTIAEMKENNMTEKDLIPLVDYLDKYDFLKKMMDEEKQPAKKLKYIKKDTLMELEKLSSDEAECYWKILRDGKIVDKNNQPLKLSWSEKGQLANKIAEKLGIKNVWSVMGRYWNLNSKALKTAFDKSGDYKSTGVFIDKITKLLH